MNTTQRQQEATHVVQGSMPAEGRQSAPQNRLQFWPADSEMETRSSALLQEVLTELDKEGAVQDRLAGYRAESQGE